MDPPHARHGSIARLRYATSATSATYPYGVVAHVAHVAHLGKGCDSIKSWDVVTKKRVHGTRPFAARSDVLDAPRHGFVADHRVCAPEAHRAISIQELYRIRRRRILRSGVRNHEGRSKTRPTSPQCIGGAV